MFVSLIGCSLASQAAHALPHLQGLLKLYHKLEQRHVTLGWRLPLGGGVEADLKVQILHLFCTSLNTVIVDLMAPSLPSSALE